MPKSEKNPWWAAILLTVFIYATLPVMPYFTKFFYGLVGIITVRTGLNVCLVLSAISFLIFLALKTKPGSGELAIIFLIIATGIIGSTRYSVPEERIHFIEYGVLGHLLLNGSKKKWKSPIWPALVLVAVIGTGDEIIQRFLPIRVWDVKDIFMNIIGGVSGICISQLLSKRSRV